MSQQLWADKLTSVDEEESTSAWTQFFLNETAVKQFLQQTPSDRVWDVLQAGLQWSGRGWGTTKCALVLKQLTGLSLVQSTLTEYNKAFLYSVALAAAVDVPQLDLSPAAADVAFKLHERWVRGVVEGAEDETEQVTRLSWQQVLEELPADLKLVVERVQQGEKLDVRMFLENVPQWTSLKTRAEDNNHRVDAKSSQDKFLKNIQQKLLNMARVQALLHTVLSEASEDVVMVSHQAFFYLLPIEQEVVRERKRLSIPSSLSDTSNVLFKQEDLRQEALVRKVNLAGMFDGQLRPSHFPTDTGPPRFKFKGKGKSYGSFGSAGFAARGAPRAPFYSFGKGGRGKGAFTRTNPTRSANRDGYGSQCHTSSGMAPQRASRNAYDSIKATRIA